MKKKITSGLPALSLIELVLSFLFVLLPDIVMVNVLNFEHFSRSSLE